MPENETKYQCPKWDNCVEGKKDAAKCHHYAPHELKTANGVFSTCKAEGPCPACHRLSEAGQEKAEETK